MTKLSLIICAHNPRIEYINTVLETLKAQTLPVTQWELLLIDNGSHHPLSKVIDLSWHPLGRHIYEENLGLTPARLRGINEANTDLLLFVDDDNCLKNDYLEICVVHMSKNTLIGTLGAGKIIPKYEVEPAAEVIPFVKMLALRYEDQPIYSNEIKFSKAIPYGAGLCIRKSFALDYATSCLSRPFNNMLGRTGNHLLSGEDVDMALHVCKAGFLTGIIPELELVHLIPKSRLSSDYLVKIAAGHAYSHYILGKIWGYLKDYPQNLIRKKLHYFNQLNNQKGLSKKIYKAEYKAIEDAREVWNQIIVK